MEKMNGKRLKIRVVTSGRADYDGNGFNEGKKRLGSRYLRIDLRCVSRSGERLHRVLPRVTHQKS